MKVNKEFDLPVSKERREMPRKEFIDVLKMFAPGTSLRTALNDIIRANMGALIVVDNGNIDGVFEKGFRINAKFSSQRLMELAKMDGAIILSRNMKKIVFANSLLIPDHNIPTRETGTRHKAAERTSVQTGAIVLAISERKNKSTLYYGDIRYELMESSEILRRAAETMQILEKQRDVLGEALNNFNLLELNKIVTINDVASILQKFEVIHRVSAIVKKYLVELGKEGLVVNLRLKDLTRGLEKEEDLILKDYFEKKTLTEKLLEKMDFDFLLDPENVSRMLFEELHDRPISPRGWRLLSKTNILEKYIEALIARFRNLDIILSRNERELCEIFENEGLCAFFKKELYNLREKISLGKQI
ncbi:MAG: DNA integrity scanning diadenylate cyclase DisA [Nanoarchaeota archaeon]|nr:DNA integrity scanning diadenylate cyclase DisA [Nanoarchaeota archaeon]